jgi:hypothetical protein
MTYQKKKLTRRDYVLGAGIILGAAAATGGFGFILVYMGG